MKLQPKIGHIIIEGMGDKQVLRHIKKGEIDWYAVIVKKYTGRIHQYVSSRLFDKNEADDLVQKTFINFYRAIDRFDENRDILPYLFEIAKNELKMFFRSRKETAPLNDQTMADSSVNPASEADIEDMLAPVAPEQRRALRMLYEGYTYREIAVTLKRPINTVKTLVRRARLLLTIRKET